tara:strand:+ start:1598 stop:1882 length:285 start_codon:yes stop_codon:yes gene_type:complete
MTFIHKRKESRKQTKPDNDLEGDVCSALSGFDFHIQRPAALGEQRDARTDSPVVGEPPGTPLPWFKFWPLLAVFGGILFYLPLLLILTVEILIQ